MLDALDDKQSITSTIDQFTENFGIVQKNDQSRQKEKNKVHTSTKSFTIEEQAGVQVRSNVDSSDNMFTKEKESPRKTGIGSVHSINKNNYTPELSKKNPNDLKNHTI